MSVIKFDIPAGDPVIIGAGIAGLVVALSMAPNPVILLNKNLFGLGATAWAQGGVAAALGGDDTVTLHAADTILAGARLVDPLVAEMVAAAAPGAIEFLQKWGVAFDNEDGKQSLALRLEAGHSRRRIVHAGGDATGFAIMRALTEKAMQTSSITMLQGRAVKIHTVNERVAGLTIAQGDDSGFYPTNAVVIATGGMGQLYQHTTNPPGASGDGLFLGAMAGAVLTDLEFVQFHPTALDLGKDPMPLATEALRGDGARLIREDGSYLLNSDLVGRDVVARAIWAALSNGEKIRLDCRDVTHLRQRFPSVYKSCIEAGLDLAATPAPVHPAAHFHMGGIETDTYGKSSIEGLWACGEAAGTKLHGANRLASNSLLEATVIGQRVASSLRRAKKSSTLAELQPEPIIASDPAAETYRAVMDNCVGVIRNGNNLRTGLRELYSGFAAKTPAATVSFLIALAALEREESRGAHTRSDFPELGAPTHSRMTLAEADRKSKEFS